MRIFYEADRDFASTLQLKQYSKYRVVLELRSYHVYFSGERGQISNKREIERFGAVFSKYYFVSVVGVEEFLYLFSDLEYFFTAFYRVVMTSSSGI